ncbi:hypothetical protein [Bifidobacterium sp. ESL0790]|uniref:hypothetical protein n=1 Tax=Bifidobacterium sp. ESL0790 TaxID=2983233 RepID=UPI0023F82C2D|nr:hypothetical protein [Bifidobacterium sp. ESL0790]WEV72381.1 hypothetical protein OZY47_08190 [Bifidobacterium sp. ESL0790]
MRNQAKFPKRINYAKRRASALTRERVKNAILLLAMFLLVATAVFATFKAMTTVTIVTDNPGTISAVYLEPEEDVQDADGAYPAMLLTAPADGVAQHAALSA